MCSELYAKPKQDPISIGKYFASKINLSHLVPIPLVASAAVHSKTVVLLFMIHCLLLRSLFVGGLWLIPVLKCSLYNVLSTVSHCR